MKTKEQCTGKIQTTAKTSKMKSKTKIFNYFCNKLHLDLRYLTEF